MLSIAESKGEAAAFQGSVGLAHERKVNHSEMIIGVSDSFLWDASHRNSSQCDSLLWKYSSSRKHTSCSSVSGRTG